MRILTIILFLFIGSESKSQTGWANINLGLRDYKSVNFINQNTGFIFGGDGTIFKTTNCGNSWTLLTNSELTFCRKGFFVTENFGYTFGGGLKKTTNGGINWVSLGPINVLILGLGTTRDIFFTDENTCFTAGSDFYYLPTPCCFDGIINKAINSGANWTQVRRENYCEFTEIKFKDENNGCVLSNFFILRTSDGGNSFNYQSDINVYGISMTDPYKDTIYIAGYLADSGAVTRSTDGGNNWTICYYRSNRLFKTNFINSVTGYCTGNRGTIIKTTNAGENWTTLNSGTTKRLNDVYFINKDTGFVVGDSGMVLRTTTGGILTGITEPTTIAFPNSFALSQNYPNPFNPSTTISYSIPVSGIVSIKIYDLTGREIKTLVNELKEAGRYDAGFDGSNLSSGVYYYKIESGSFTQIRKMVLLK